MKRRHFYEDEEMDIEDQLEDIEDTVYGPALANPAEAALANH